jgi:hypothetical protein
MSAKVGVTASAVDSYRVVHHDVDTILSTAWDEFALDVPGDGVVHGLVDGGLHPTAFFGNVVDFGDFPSGVVTETELDELALLEQLVAGLESLLKWDAAIWCMQVQDVDTVCTELAQ